MAATDRNLVCRLGRSKWRLNLLWLAAQSAQLAVAGTLGPPVYESRTHSLSRSQTAVHGNLIQVPLVQPLMSRNPQSTPQGSDLPHPAVVRVIAPEHGAISYGSGTLVDVRDQFGLVITNWHVVRDAQGDVEVLFADGFRSKARALKVDADWDLAALVIWRPSVPPVTLAASAPRPGDPLTICGYGQGRYRAVTGRCTQYYAPKENLPQQMVELDVEARQGDSGGPIFNDRGELAGVLFGAGQGTTLGSFGGRVQSFLATLAPDIGRRADEALLLVESLQHGPEVTHGGRTSGNSPVGNPTNSETTNWGRAGRASYPARSMAGQFADRDSYQGDNSDIWKPTEQTRNPYEAHSSHIAHNSHINGTATAKGAKQIGQLYPAEDNTAWHAVAGVGWYEQAKSVLAAIGLLAIVGGVLRAAR